MFEDWQSGKKRKIHLERNWKRIDFKKYDNTNEENEKKISDKNKLLESINNIDIYKNDLLNNTHLLTIARNNIKEVGGFTETEIILFKKGEGEK